MLKLTLKRIFVGSIILAASLLLLIWFSNFWIKKTSEPFLYNDVRETPKLETGLLLGTSKYMVAGGVNPYFKNRMDAAAELFFAGKLQYIIVSGDNSIQDYNETKQMKEYLVELGVPEEVIVEDFAGFRTLDSVVRANRVFGRDSILIISQKFHNERAVYIAQQFGIFAVGYNAKSVKTYSSTYREYLARVKALLDLHILGTEPKFYKETEIFPTDSIKI